MIIVDKISFVVSQQKKKKKSFVLKFIVFYNYFLTLSEAFPLYPVIIKLIGVNW